MKLKTAILGVTGYVGQQLLSLLSAHPNVELGLLTSEKFSGSTTDEAFPHLGGRVRLPLVSVSKIDAAGPLDLVFSCLPGGTSAVFVKRFLEKGARAIDLSADLRHATPDDHARAFGTVPRHPELLSRAVYGLSELNRGKIKGAFLVANPGCYSTCVSLGIAPFLKTARTGDDIVVDVKSSLSTSGRAPRLDSHFAEAAAEVSVENAGGRDQEHEILRVLRDFCGEKGKKLLLVNTRVPVKRGIMAVSYLKTRSQVRLDEVEAAYRKFYEKDVFVRVHDGKIPGIASVAGSNYLSVGFGTREGYLVVVSVLDNLMKGAAGQAVQNMNIVFGFSEDEGLRQTPVFP